MYDCIIIGAGTAGMSAGIVSAQKKLKTLVIAKQVSKSVLDDETELVKFSDVEKKFEKTLHDESEVLEFKETEVISIEKNVVSFSVEIKNGEIIYSRSIIIATGKVGADFDGITDKDQEGKIKVDANMVTNVEGVYAIGGANNAYHHNVMIGVGEAAKAVAGVGKFLNNKPNE